MPSRGKLDISMTAGRGINGSRSNRQRQCYYTLTSVLVAILVSAPIGGVLLWERVQDSMYGTTTSTELHDPIMINGNDDFEARATFEGWPGDGTAGNPYVIEGYEINGSAAADAVAIWNTDVHFVIRECFIHDAPRNGIYLSGTSHGVIHNNTLSHRSDGSFFSSSDVTLETSDNITLDSNTVKSARGYQCNDVVFQDNEFSSSDDGAISMTGSERISVLNNSFSGYLWGVSLSWVNAAEVSNCSFDNVTNGLSLFSCANVSVGDNRFQGTSDRSMLLTETLHSVLRNNSMDEGGIEIWAFSVTEESWTTHSIDASNEVAGRPVWYCSGQTGSAVPANVSQVLLANCSQMVVEGLTIQNVSVGISACYSDNCSVSNNSMLNCSDGVMVSMSSAFVVSGNSLDSRESSVLVHHSPNVTVADNLITGSLGSYAGIEASGCEMFLVQNNTCVGEFEHGIVIYASPDSAALNNTCANCSIGILLAEGYSAPTPDQRNLTADGNLLSNCSVGIMVYSADCILRNNTMVGCGLMPHGLVSELELVDADTSNTVNGLPLVYLVRQNGGVVDSDAGQVILVNCTGVSVRDLLIENATAGILLCGSSACMVANNTCMSCNGCEYYRVDRMLGAISVMWMDLNGAGIGLLGSSGNTVESNMCDGCDVGLNVRNEDEYEGELRSCCNVVSNNTFDWNEMGVCIAGDSSIVVGNLISNSSYYGAYVSGTNNSLYLNDFLYNHGSSETYNPSYVQACDDGVGNTWNSSDSGNFWSDWQTPDDNADGVVDVPYMINGTSLAEDALPLVVRATPIPEMSLVGTLLATVSIACAVIVLSRTRKNR